MRFSIYQDSAIGGRTVNQDRMGYCYTREALLMVVADGMGGHARGEVAADITVRTMGALFQREAQGRIEDPRRFLDTGLRAAHHEILRYQKERKMPEPPRTTVVACLVQDGQAWWAHAGDARLYWLRGDRVMARTRDHSRVQNRLELGLISVTEPETHPDRNKG
ncbi:MAG: serine/threonine-protein phosphatase, partial [Burkholderiales bacterium]